jgi:hypothetical protein
MLHSQTFHWPNSFTSLILFAYIVIDEALHHVVRHAVLRYSAALLLTHTYRELSEHDFTIRKHLVQNPSNANQGGPRFPGPTFKRLSTPIYSVVRNNFMVLIARPLHRIFYIPLRKRIDCIRNMLTTCCCEELSTVQRKQY